MSENSLIPMENIRSRIYTIRGVQVMLDSDLAELYGVEVKRLNEQVKRNMERFPKEFMFQLSKGEYELLRSQNVMLKTDNLKSQNATSNGSEILKSQNATSSWGGRRTLPYAFTEQGVAMLSAVLRSETAVRMSVQIINAFVEMRRFLAANYEIFRRLDTLEIKQLETGTKIEKVLDALENKEIQPEQGIFFDGQVFDAYKFVSDLFRSAEESIVIIDNYIDDSVLVHLTKRKKGVKVTIFTKRISEQLALDAGKFNEQYPPLEIKEFKNAHDRFIIIDERTVYQIGASLKDLGKKWFAFSKMEIEALDMLSRLNKGKNTDTHGTENPQASPPQSKHTEETR